MYQNHLGDLLKHSNWFHLHNSWISRGRVSTENLLFKNKNHFTWLMFITAKGYKANLEKACEAFGFWRKPSI
jgi:hypothetical protein